jgi:multidrug efflux pump subunit AcrA (membrane-fusion protein)
MPRHLALAALAAAMFCSLPAAHAQEDLPELDGGPPPLQVPKPAQKPTPKPVPPKSAPKAATPSTAPRASAADANKLKAEQALLARQAEAQKAEQLRLDRQAAELQAEQARLDARAAEIAAQEARLARLRVEQDIAETRQLAERERQRVIAPIESAESPGEPAPPRASPRPRFARINYEAARRACTRAGMDEAVDRDFYSARYEFAPRLFERERELRGLMRMDDRRGYLLVDTVCELDDDGMVLHFEMLR